MHSEHLPEAKRPWERQPDEGPKPFAAFKVYLEMGDGRSTAAVGRKLCKSGGLMERWCAAYGWPARVAAYEAHLDGIRREEEAKAERDAAIVWAERRAKLREEEFTVGIELLAKAKAMLEFPLAPTVTKGDNGQEIHMHPARWSFADAARMLEIGFKLGRLAVDWEIEHVEKSRPEGGPMPVEKEISDDEMLAIAARVTEAMQLSKAAK